MATGGGFKHSIFSWKTKLVTLTFVSRALIFLLGLLLFTETEAQNPGAKAEMLWGQINFTQIQEKVKQRNMVSKADSVMFFQSYMVERMVSMQNEFFHDILGGKMSEDSILKK